MIISFVLLGENKQKFLDGLKTAVMIEFMCITKIYLIRVVGVLRIRFMYEKLS